jgi:DNA-binding response OmpR family regulator
MSDHTVTRATAMKRVLIVDDEPHVLNVLRDFFASFQHGHTYALTTAACAADAFQILRRDRFDLILLDLVLPATKALWLTNQNLGLDVLRRIRDLGVTAPVLMMTGGAGGTVKEVEALNVGAAGYLYKPIGLRELDQAVTLMLGSRPR